MASYERFYDPKVLARVGRLELRAQMIVEGIITGMHKSPYQGHSVEFIDHRAYVPGDDPRHIDWKVLGRADRIVLKRFEEETNLRGHLLLDCSESMRYGIQTQKSWASLFRRVKAAAGQESVSVDTSERIWTKFEYGGTLAASIAYLLQRQHDSVGLSLFDSEVRTRIQASSHPMVLARLGEAMARAETVGKTGLGKLFQAIAEELPRRGLVVVISDLFAPPDEIRQGLEAFAIRKHDVIVFHIFDETELTFPFEGNTLFHGLEGYPEIIAEPRTLREGYLEALREFLDAVEKTCAGLGIHYMRTHTGEPLDAAILSVVAARSRMTRRR